MPESELNNLLNVIAARSGLAPKNRFFISFSAPAAANIFGNVGADVNLLCEQVVIPGKRIVTVDNATNETTYMYPASYQYSEISLQFYVTNDYFIKTLFDLWANSIVNPQTCVVAYKNTITTTITIQQLNQQDYPIFEVTLLNAFVTNINQIDLSHGSDNDFQRLNVTISFDNMETRIPTPSQANVIQSILDAPNYSTAQREAALRIVAESGSTSSNATLGAIQSIFQTTNTSIENFVTAITEPIDQVVNMISVPLDEMDYTLNRILSVPGQLLNSVGNVWGIGNRVTGMVDRILSIQNKVNVLTNIFK